MNELATTLDTIITVFIIISIIEFIAIVLIAYNVSKIKDVECKPFQNKRPDYPNKVIELLQNINVMQQKQNDEIRQLKNQIAVSQNKGNQPGMKSKELLQLEEITKLHNQQIELLSRISDSASGEEKKKLLEKWKQATEIINNLDEK